MTKRRTTKHALLMSGLALLLCISMLVGSTYAWFTDSVTSTGNIIKSGTLQIEMLWANGKDDPSADTTAWTDASTGAMFENDLWEPGYVEARHISIANVGTLALKYQMRLLADGVTSVLANVIDVYYFDTATQLDRTTVKNGTKLGTLSQVLNNMPTSILATTFKGELEPNNSKTITLALVMQETAGNEYQGLSIGSDFAVQVMATQLTSEEDSFNEFYDKDAEFAPQEPPKAMVFQLDEATASKIDVNGIIGLDTAYSFQPTETYEQAEASEYVWDHADFFVYADNTVPADSMVLAGYYSAFGSWLGLSNAGFEVKAGPENGIRLINDGLRSAGFNVTVAYSDICLFGNDGVGFLCGAKDLTGENAGTKLTVELRLYEVACTDAGCHHNDPACETGEYITVGKFEYTFDPLDSSKGDAYIGGTYYETLTDALAAANSGDSIMLTDDLDAEVGIVIPEGVTLDGNGKTITYAGTDYHLIKLGTGAALKDVTLNNYRVRTEETTSGTVALENVAINMDNDLTGLDISRGSGTATLTGVTCKGIKDATHLNPATQVQVEYTPYGDVLLGTKWGLEATDCAFGSLHGWNTTNGSNVSLTNTTYSVFRMHYWNNRTLYINGVQTAWAASDAVPVAHDVGGCWSVQPAFK